MEYTVEQNGELVRVGDGEPHTLMQLSGWRMAKAALLGKLWLRVTLKIDNGDIVMQTRVFEVLR